MKKIFTLVSCLFLTGMFTVNIQAQTIPNNGFESWSGTNIATSWKSNNTATVFFLRQSTDKHSGTYAAQILTLANGSAGNLSGILTLGTVNFTTPQTVTGGIPISSKPTDLHGYYKYTAGSGADNASITVTMTKWLGSSHITLASASFTTTLGTSTTTYTLFTIPITYSPNTIIPDTFNITCKSSQTTAVIGSILLVDDLAFTTSTGIDEPINFEPSMFPNPANDKLFLNLSGEDYNITITNMIGQPVVSASTKKKSYIVETSQLPVGLYIVNFESKSHHFTKKLLVNR